MLKVPLRTGRERSGQSIIEILVAVAIGAILIIGGVGLIAPTFQTNKAATTTESASVVGSGLMDSVRVWADGNWNGLLSLATGTTNKYFLHTTSSPFTVASGTEAVSIATTTFVRYFSVADVFRDSSGNVTGTGNYDPSTKQITVYYGLASSTPSNFSIFLTRNRSVTILQTDWSGGSGQSGAVTSLGNRFSTSSNVVTSPTVGAITLPVEAGQACIQ